MNPKGYPQTLRTCAPGEVRNPNGYNGHTKRRPVAAAVQAFLDEQPELRLRELAQIFYAMATGHREALKLRDGTLLEPDFTWFRELLDRVDGKVTDRLEASVCEEPPPLQLTEEQLNHWAAQRVRMAQYLAERRGEGEEGGAP
jgi:hypothetical protein